MSPYCLQVSESGIASPTVEVHQIDLYPPITSYLEIAIPKMMRQATTKGICVPLKQAYLVKNPVLLQPCEYFRQAKSGPHTHTHTHITLHITRGMFQPKKSTER